MPAIVYQLAALAMIVTCLAVGYRRWVRPAAPSPAAAAMLLLVVLALAGGFVGAYFWWVDDVRAFAWDLPPLASRLLAAAGLSFAAASYLALEQPTRLRLRFVLALIATYLAPLAVAIPLFHLDRFDLGASITYGFLAVVAVMVVPAVAFLVRQPATRPDEPADLAPPAPAIRAWLTAVAVVAALWGLALFATDDGGIVWLWLWPGDLLTSRLIAVMLLTVAAGAVLGRAHAAAARLALALMAVYGLVGAAAVAWNTVAGKPVKGSYLAALAALGVGSAMLGARWAASRGGRR
ncbi:MAG: hypothetical protein U0470_00645 [Anaerolineae bacterium]